MSFQLRIKRKCLLRKYGSNPAFKRFFSDVNLNQKVMDTTFVVFDTETTGLDPKRAELVSIGAVRIEGMSLNLSSSFHEFVKPDELSRSSVEVHGITSLELESRAKPLREVLELFLTYVKGSVIVGFNVEFDKRMVEKYTYSLFGIPLSNYRLDVFHLWKRRGGAGKSLKEIAQELDIPAVGAHSALDDAYMTALIFLKLAYKLRGEPISSLPLML
ncbi:DNA polymerase-3 subunit epsilon [Hydrogenivirga caldilitoris]|uniref:DNA polymerase-3 subunit epsilon n=1 Tax=Hydrogenivirga caldilitoris TaxID=246264 RepID=A0A497XQJ7_9AQUI|nr:3'-5' exonuclease [Hydrogenivirga caldilitoris]RLJ71235.1 DNA polymerase-3 subunit epsilon [Hydrogenivirga caldilitoris]